MVYLVLEVFMIFLQVHILILHDIKIILQHLNKVFQSFGGPSFVLVRLGLGLLDFVELFWKFLAGFHIAGVGAGVFVMHATLRPVCLYAIHFNVSDHA